MIVGKNFLVQQLAATVALQGDHATAATTVLGFGELATNLAVAHGNRKIMRTHATPFRCRNTDAAYLMLSERRSDPLWSFFAHAPEVTGCLLQVWLYDLAHDAFNKLGVLLCYLYHRKAGD